MNRVVNPTLCFLFAASCTWADEPATEKGAEPTAVVQPMKCVFMFPIDNIDRTWKWGVSPANQCEYHWMVTVKGQDASYQLGYSYFNPTAVPQAGTFDDLLDSGQSNVWKLNPDGKSAKYVDGVKVISESTNNALRVSIENAEWIKRLFGDRPKTVEFETRGTQLKRHKTDVNVDYDGASLQ